MVVNMKNVNNLKNPRTASHPGAIRGLFYSCSKLNRYLRSVLQGIHQAVIVVDGNVVNHSVPKLFVKLDGRCGGLGEFKEHTADGNRLGISLFALCCEAFELFLLGAEAVGEVIVTAAVFLFAHSSGGVEHHRLPYHFGEDVHLPLASLNVIVYKIGVRQRFLHVPKGVDGCLAVGKVDGEHFKELLLKLFCGEVGGGTFDGVMKLVDALPYDTAVFIV